jgi:molybdopterin-containing oxidoreductase family membrane subunit
MIMNHSNDPVVSTVPSPGEHPTVDGDRLGGYLTGQPTLSDITETISRIAENRAPRWWWYAFAVSAIVAVGGIFAAVYLISTGVGVWGLNQPVGWAFDITNLVFWIGIGHAGTLISAILFLFRQKWRTSINRFAEAMTLFAVLCAGIFPTIHVGRIWMLWFFAPLPNDQAIWPQFYSPLMWDAFAIGTYATVSLLFWYLGLIPDLATFRDRAQTRTRQIIFGVLALGWRGAAQHWRHYETAYLLLAGLATPLVVSVHSVVSMDFATSVLPGWHATIFPPYFVAGAIFSGFAMVLTLMIPMRQLFGLQNFITDRHLDHMAKVLLATGLMVGYAYSIEFFSAWYSGNETERFVFWNRAFGPYGWSYWIMVSCNVLVPQLFWVRRFRTHAGLLFVASIFVNVGMWFERFVIIVTSLHRDFLPGSWGMFVPTWVDGLQMIGAFGLFFALILIFVRLLPAISIAEMKMLLPAHTVGTPDDPSASTTMAPMVPGQTLAAQFRDMASLETAVAKCRERGWKDLEALTPYPSHHLFAALKLPRSPLPLFTLAGGLFGLSLGLLGMWYIHGVEYPIIVGGKQPGSWQGFVPVAFEMTILFAAFATVGGLFWKCGLPKLSHPVFRLNGFDRVTNDRFFLIVKSAHETAGSTLLETGAVAVTPVTEDV